MSQPESLKTTVLTPSEMVLKVKEVHKIQAWHGNWNYSPYMRGLFNGLELALAIMEDRKPSYKNGPIPPDRYLCDLPYYKADAPEYAQTK
jgi:hypothetical protein